MEAAVTRANPPPAPTPHPRGFMLASVRSNNSARVWGSEEPPHLDPRIIKMPEAQRAPGRGCFSSPAPSSCQRTLGSLRKKPK